LSALGGGILLGVRRDLAGSLAQGWLAFCARAPREAPRLRRLQSVPEGTDRRVPKPPEEAHSGAEPMEKLLVLPEEAGRRQ